MTKRKWIFAGILELIFILMFLIGGSLEVTKEQGILVQTNTAGIIKMIGGIMTILLPILMIKLIIEELFFRFKVWLNESSKKRKTDNYNKYNNYKQYTQQNYKKREILTENEKEFYKALLPVADKLGYTVLTKIRVADLVKPNANLVYSDWQSAFNKIKSKHVDFALAQKVDLKPVLLIELDDNTHIYNQETIERDKLINQIYEQAGLNLLHMNNANNIEYVITDTLNRIRYKSNSAF